VGFDKKKKKKNAFKQPHTNSWNSPKKIKKNSSHKIKLLKVDKSLLFECFSLFSQISFSE
jgi:hypothetical protein